MTEDLKDTIRRSLEVALAALAEARELRKETYRADANALRDIDKAQAEVEALNAALAVLDKNGYHK